MITDKQRVGSFLRKLDRLCKEHAVNIRGHVAFFDEEWGDWLELVCNGERSVVKAGEEVQEFNTEEKLEEMHRDMLLMRSDLLEFTELVLKKKVQQKKKPT
ncbi:MAG: hypothetical protein M0R80_01320 [Proteobacteria bacterium]|jgi:hypothetical protein|nr:hypothetical protein [Pseudomonadota bacterium]